MMPRRLEPRRLLGRITAPRILVASVPKAGTHLLTRTLSLFPQLRLGTILVGHSPEEQVSRLSSIRRGQVAVTHSGPSSALDELLDQRDIRVLFILRDPRDVCVSFMHWVTYKDKQNPHRPYFAALPHDGARLMATIVGMAEEAKKPGAWWDDIHTEMSKRLPWRSHPRCWTVTFEALVGSKGGGDDPTQLASVTQVAQHLNLALTDHDIQYITDHIFATTTTFRRGQIGDWSNHFRRAHKDKFKSIAGQLLIELGYEADLDW